MEHLKVKIKLVVPLLGVEKNDLKLVRLIEGWTR
jgi:hypothetical protein